MIDTHCHLYTSEFDDDIAEVMGRAAVAGVTKCYLPAIDKSCTGRMDLLEAAYPATCFAMAGLHPCSVKGDFQTELDHVRALLQQRKFAGIGETGLDLYWDKTFIREQVEALKIQVEWALEYKLPLILHTRNATQETIDVIKNYRDRGLHGIFHCFGGTLNEAQQIIDLNFYLGIGGVVTYKNAGLAEVIADVDMKHLVLETDAPYLAPAPMRGKRNETAYVAYIAERLASVKNISTDEVKRITTENAQKIFGV
ncbi:MAG: TatD family hydrolase [Ferruginibacter sp.]